MANRRVKNYKRRKNLKSSENAIGQLYPVLRDAKGKVIDGYHRLDANPDWKSVTLENVKTEEERLIVSAHVNLGRRVISPREIRIIINSLAEIYYQQGLRPDAYIMGKVGMGKDPDKLMRRNFNEIKNKLGEVLDGIISKEKIRKYLDSKYLNQDVAKGNKEYYKKRRENNSPYGLLKSSHGNQLRKIYGDNFFERLDEEMFQKGLDKAKKFLRNSVRFRREIEMEIRKTYDENIRMIVKETEERMRKEIKAEFEYDQELMVVA